MKLFRHEFDPQGDVKLVLKNPNTQVLITPETSLRLLQVELKCRESALKLSPSPASGSGQHSSQQGVPPGPANKTSPISPAEPIKKTDVPPAEIRMLLSSRHLILASPFFRKMLQGPWQEGTADAKNPREITASGWDEKALVIVLDIIHGHHRHVPKSLDLETLAKVAIMVDYYGCIEAMEPYIRPWIIDIDEPLPIFYGPNCLLWLCVSWVFSQAEIFESMTSLVVKHSDGLIDAPDLPIGEILEEIEMKRIALIDRILASLETHCDKLNREEAACGWECSSMLLGSVMKGKRTLAELQPPVARPYQATGHSLTSVLTKVEEFREPKWSTYDERHLRKNQHPCTVAALLQPSIQSVQREMKGFKLETFGRSPISSIWR